MADQRVGFVIPTSQGQVSPANPDASATHPTEATYVGKNYKLHTDAPKLADMTTRQSWADYPSKPLPNPEESETENMEEGE